MLGEITDISDNTVTVRPNDSAEEIEVGMETWQNSRFTLTKKTNEIEEGSGRHFQANPPSLGVGITVHKSQGSEFPIVIIPSAWVHPLLATRNLLYTAVTRGKNGGYNRRSTKIYRCNGCKR